MDKSENNNKKEKLIQASGKIQNARTNATIAIILLTGAGLHYLLALKGMIKNYFRKTTLSRVRFKHIIIKNNKTFIKKKKL